MPGATRAHSRLPERVVLAVLALWSLVPLAVLFVSVGDGLGIGSGGRTFLGVDGPDVADQLQYMSWLRDAGDHFAFANQFDLAADPHLFVHPLFALSGLVWKLGASVPLSFLLWKPVAVIVLFAGFAAYVRRTIEPGWARLAALFLALFFFTPAAWLLDWGGLGSAKLRFETLVVALEMFPGGYVWGLWPLAISVGLMPVFLLCLEGLLEPAWRRPGRSAAWYAAGAAAAGLLSAWLHPWQGLTLLVLTAGLVVWGRLWRRAALALPLAATAAPLAYYYVLSETDSSWAFVSHHADNPHLGGWLVLGLAPALLLAAVGAPGRDLDLQERALRLWPLAALAVYFALDNAWFYHALAGLTLPLAILGVRGWQRLRIPRAVAVGAVAALTLPGMAFYVQKLRESSAAHFVAADEARALRGRRGQSPRRRGADERRPRPGGAGADGPAHVGGAPELDAGLHRPREPRRGPARGATRRPAGTGAGAFHGRGLRRRRVRAPGPAARTGPAGRGQRPLRLRGGVRGRVRRRGGRVASAASCSRAAHSASTNGCPTPTSSSISAGGPTRFPARTG